MRTLLDRFRAHVARTRAFARPGVAVVAVSGGADSVALLDLLAAVAPDAGLTLVVAHADHGIQTDSRSVGQAVRELAGRYGLAFELGELRLGPDATETAARRARYAWLGEVRRRRRARYLVTAHHRDDQIETILMRVLRGSAPAGLAGMPARGRGGLVRPLLPFTKRELAARVAERGLPAHDDPANADPRHLRSWVRGQLVPRLVERLGDRVAEDVLRLGRHAAAERRAWDHVLDLVPELGVRAAPGGFDVARAVLARYDSPLGVALLRAAARRAGLVLGPDRARRLLELARGSSGRTSPLGGGWSAEIAFDRLRVSRGAAVRDSRTVAAAAGSLVATRERGSAAFGSFRVSWQLDDAPRRVGREGWTTWVDELGWEVRGPAPGDEVLPLGGVGHRAVRRLLMEARVPRSERSSYPVVARGDTILWVPGICRGAAGLPRPGTKAVRLDVIRDGEPQEDRWA